MSDRPELHDQVQAELGRLQLRQEDMPYDGVAFGSPQALKQFVAHLRGLEPGATWYDVFLDLNGNDERDDDPYRDRGRPLGSFDYQSSPRGSAVFASVNSESEVAEAAAALARASELQIPIFGTGLVLDRGHPPLYIVIRLGAPDEHAWRLADFLRKQPGIDNAYPQRLESSSDRGT